MTVVAELWENTEPEAGTFHRPYKPLAWYIAGRTVAWQIEPSDGDLIGEGSDIADLGKPPHDHWTPVDVPTGGLRAPWYRRVTVEWLPDGRKQVTFDPPAGRGYDPGAAQSYLYEYLRGR